MLTRKPGLSKPVLGFANIMQTVPSLALFGFLIPLNIYLFHVKIVGGIGARTAIVALVLYALLPIIRNTFTGISGVDPAIREAGRGMGMTDRQLLFQVELPLALGVIIAGVRVATVICVGTATIAAAIDAGGLGRYIFRGLRANDNMLILAGAVPAALIAVARRSCCSDTSSARFSSAARSAQAVEKTSLVRRCIAVLAVARRRRISSQARAPVRSRWARKILPSRSFSARFSRRRSKRKTGLQVVRRFDLGGNLAHEALVAGEIDVYVEYTGTALLAILKKPAVSRPAGSLTAGQGRIRQAVQARMDRAARLQQHLCDSGARRRRAAS